MSATQTTALNALSSLVDKAALELVFAQAGADNGLLPINSFLVEMEESCGRETFPDEIVSLIADARMILDDLLVGGAVFTQESIDQLGAWAPKFQASIRALQTGKSVSVPSKPTEGSEHDLILNLESDRELLQEFANESREHLQSIETGALKLEENPNDRAMLDAVFRAFHTFKGGSGFLNLTPINKLAHELESLLELVRQGKIQITSEVADLILEGGDTLRRFIEAIEGQLAGQAAGEPIVIPTGSLRERVALVIAVPAHLTPQNFEGQTEFLQRAVTAVAPTLAARHSVSGTTTVKVDTQKLDSLIDLVGEMVIAQSLVAQDSDLKSSASARLNRNLAQLARTTKELQRTAMALRMIPIRATFQKMTRLVRDVSAQAGKDVELVLRGEETELDRNIVEEISDPLIHMLRNAIDHGIEKPEVRVARGKPARGRITLSALHQGGNFVVKIQDDGAGLDPDRISQKAASLGLIDPSVERTQKEIYNLIFAPGFSTAETLTDLSGRGVGMDIVRRNIEKLRGRIETESTLGQGASFSIVLPLTLAIIDGLIVRLGVDRYIIPTLSVRESFRPAPAMVSTIQGQGEIVSVRGRLLPLLRLQQWLSPGAPRTDATQGVVVIVQAEGEERCVLVDELINKQEVVIKSLGETFHDHPLLAGAAILGDGRVGLILDVNSLVQPFAPPLSKAA